MTKPNLYALSLPVQGDLGDTKVKTHSTCSTCNNTPKNEYYDWKISFDAWNGEDIVSLTEYIFVSERLKQVFEEEGIQGAEFEPIQVIQGDYFEIGEDAYQTELPVFYKLNILKKITIDEWPGWTLQKICTVCNKKKWNLLDLQRWLSYSVLPVSGEKEVEARQVDFEQWDGEDIFQLEQHSEAIITDKLKSLLENIGQRDINFYSSKWID